jgi:ERCC4-type nuclease
LEPPDSIDSTKDADLVFPGSSVLAAAFEATVLAILSGCEDADGNHRSDCMFTHNWNEIYQFLVANGRFSAILRIARTHDLELTAASLSGITRRFPHQSTRGKDQDDKRHRTAMTKTKTKSAKRQSADENLTSEAFIERLYGSAQESQKDAVGLLSELGNLEQLFTAAELELFTSEELKLLEPISADDLERW